MKHTIRNARIYAMQNDMDCARCAFDDNYFATHVADSEKHKYIRSRVRHAREILKGIHDNNFTVWQRINYYITGKCVPFLK